MTKPTTEELKDLLGKVTQGEWVADELNKSGLPSAYINAADGHPVARAVGVVSEFETEANATLIALAPTLAAEVVELRGLLWYAWREFNAIRARSGAPLTHDGMSTVAEEWWDQMTDAFEEAIGEDAAKPWPSPEARQALSEK